MNLTKVLKRNSKSLVIQLMKFKDISNTRSLKITIKNLGKTITQTKNVTTNQIKRMKLIFLRRNFIQSMLGKMLKQLILRKLHSKK